MRGRPAGPPADGTYARLIRRAWLVALLARPAALALACMHCGGFGAGAQHHTGGFPLLVDSSSVPSLARQSRRSAGRRPPFALFRLPALMDLYIYPLYVIVSKIFFSILNSSAPIHSLYHPLFTLSTIGPTCHFI
jgi:hypothetical protein